MRHGVSPPVPSFITPLFCAATSKLQRKLVYHCDIEKRFIGLEEFSVKREGGGMKKKISLLTRSDMHGIISPRSQLDSRLSPHTRLPGRISIQAAIA
jgi:hypothetical protein